MKERLEILWVAIPTLLVVICLAIDHIPKYFTKEYWENRLFCHRCKRENRAHISSTTKEEVEQWEREERRLIRKIEKYEKRKNKHR